jgi:hypothetical protein
MLNEPALAGGILIAPGVSPGKVHLPRSKSPVGVTEIPVALFEGLLFLAAWIPGLTPGATLCRRRGVPGAAAALGCLRWLIASFFLGGISRPIFLSALGGQFI